MNARAVAFAFVSTLSGLLIALPSADAQQSSRVYRIGVLNIGTSIPNPLTTPINSRLVERLAELGFRQGRNLEFDMRWADFDFDRVAPLTEQLVQSRTDVIVTVGNKIAPLVTAANPRIPMVSLSCDPFSYVSSYARPNGNFTGVTCMSTELSPKRLEVAKQLVPGARTFVYLHNPRQGGEGWELTKRAASLLGVTVAAVEVGSADALPAALSAIAAQRPDALLVYPDGLTFGKRKEIAEFALVQRIPSVYVYKEFAEAGGLASYGATLGELGDRAGELVAKILRGVKPHELPIEQARHVYLTVNLKAARALEYQVPTALLLRADYVIE